MDRRSLLGTTGVVLLAGCAQVEELAGDVGGGRNDLNDTASYDDIDVTVVDSITTEQFTLNGDEITAPSNGIFALFEVEVHNTDVTEREIPHVSETHYDTLEKDDGTIYMGEINDIRVYGDDEGGHFPDVDWDKDYRWEERDDGTRVRKGVIELIVDGEELDPYPVEHRRPSIPADDEASGWVVGVIDRDATPALKIQFNDTEEMWEAE